MSKSNALAIVSGKVDRSFGMERDIEKFLNYLIPNQDLFQQTTSTICGMVAIAQVELKREQEQRERQRDREQIDLYKQKEKEHKDRDREQMEIDSKNEDN
ncbi:hypothetical protein [Microcoleus sp. D3_18a_C4]|uniref:hypothetical protein n=1 Tax=Microcoleus sp. D3_18a_C4 TaxID=3055332 RepID=UPI002FD66481